MSKKVAALDIEMRAITDEHDRRIKESENAHKAFAAEISDTKKKLQEMRKALAQNKKALRGYKREVEAAAKSSKGFGKNIIAKRVAIVAALAAVGYGFKELVQFAGQFISQQGQIARDLDSLTAAANVNASTLQEAGYAYSQFGVEGDKAGDILKDLQDKLGDFTANGGGGMADFMDNLWLKTGRTASELKRLSGPEALIAIKQAMDEANVPMGEQIHYLESIASDASKLIPLLAEGGKKYRELALEAQAFNNSMTELEIEEWKRLDNYLQEAKSSFKAMVMEAIRPAVDDMAELAKETGQWLGLLRSDFTLDYFFEAAHAVNNVHAQIRKINEEIELLGDGEVVRSIRYEGDHIYGRESDQRRIEFRKKALEDLKKELAVREELFSKEAGHYEEMAAIRRSVSDGKEELSTDLGDIEKDIEAVTKALTKEARERLQIEREILGLAKSRTSEAGSLYQSLFGGEKEKEKSYHRDFGFEYDVKQAKEYIDSGRGAWAEKWLDQAEGTYKASKIYGPSSSYDLQGMRDVILLLREQAGLDFKDPDEKPVSVNADAQEVQRSILDIHKTNGEYLKVNGHDLKLVAENTQKMTESIQQVLGQSGPSKKFVLELKVPGKNKNISITGETKDEFGSSMADFLEGAAAGV